MSGTASPVSDRAHRGGLSGREALNVAFSATSIAVIGASSEPGKLGNLLLKTLVESGFEGSIFPVNKSKRELLGIKAYASLADIPETVDVAIVMVPSEQLIKTLEECAAKQVRVVAAITSGFAEAGPKGRILQEQLERVLETAPYRLLGPNCEGYVVPQARIFATFSLMTLGLRPGPVGIVAQSGAISGTISHRLNKMGVGIRALVSTGNESDLTAAEAMEWFADDPATNTIVCYLEQIRDAQRFIKVARRLKGNKAIVVEKPGRGKASSEAVTTHTGAIAGDDRVADGVFEELGIVRVPDLSAAIDSAAALSLGKKLKGTRIGIVSIAGGLAVEASDLVEAAGFEVPRFDDGLQAKIRESLPYFAAVRNPVDLTGAALSSPELFGGIVDHVLADDGIDAVMVIVTFSKQAAFADVLIAAGRVTDKPLLIVWTAPDTLTPEPLAAFLQHSIPVFDSPARALTGLRALARYSGLM